MKERPIKSTIYSILAAFFLLLLAINTAYSKAIKAPSWQGVEWINLDQGVESIEVSDFKGKVIYLSFFQKW